MAQLQHTIVSHQQTKTYLVRKILVEFILENKKVSIYLKNKKEMKETKQDLYVSIYNKLFKRINE